MATTFSPLSGKVVVITGSTDGIGLATAKRAASAGATVVVNGRRSESVGSVVDQLQAEGHTAGGVTGDVTDSAVIAALTDGVAERFGGVDAVVANAGGGLGSGIEQQGGAVWSEVHALNLQSVHELVMAALPHLRRSQAPRVVAVTSIAGRAYSRLSGTAYAAAKAGVHGLTRHLAHHLAAEGITVNAVAPGLVATDRALSMLASRNEAAQEAILRTIPMGRVGRPEEVAWAVVALLDPDAAYTTGAVIDVNGGSFLA